MKLEYIVREEFELESFIIYSAEIDMAVIRRSPIVPENDSSLEASRRYVSGFCNVPHPVRVGPDDGMMFNESIVEEYRVFQECPGAVPHSCAKGNHDQAFIGLAS